MPSLEATRASADAAVEYDRALIRFVKARDRLLAGEDFAEVARAVSDAPTRETGGAVGPVDPRTLVEPVRAALAKLAVGATSAPIRTELGYTVLKLERVDAARRVTFEEARERIVAQLLERRQAVAFAALLKQLRERAVLVWKDKTLQSAWENRASTR
jgi:parvulin-like peptidyl-prolyl isomerase